MNESYEQLKLGNQLCFPLYAAARKIVNLYTPHFKMSGLTYTQYIVFMALWETDGQTVGDLCKKLYLDSGTLTPLLKNLESKGSVSRHRSKEDERVLMVNVTEQGLALRDKAVSVPGELASCINLGPEDGMKLYELLYKVLDQLKN